MNLVETVLVFAVIPLAIYGMFALITLRKKLTGGPRYRPGQQWDYPPMWWTGNPDGIGEAASAPADGAAPIVATTRGGARGTW